MNRKHYPKAGETLEARGPNGVRFLYQVTGPGMARLIDIEVPEPEPMTLPEAIRAMEEIAGRDVHRDATGTDEGRIEDMEDAAAVLFRVLRGLVRDYPETAREAMTNQIRRLETSWDSIAS